MKKLLLFIICICCFQFFTNAQNVPNAGFENWTGGEPNNWLTYNSLGTATITQTTPAHSGNSAAKGQPQNIFGQIFPPYLASTNAGGAGFPVSQSFGNFSFYYKFNQAGSDEFSGVIGMYDAAGNAVGVGSFTVTNSVSSYTLANVPIVYSGGTPDTCIIIFMITDGTGGGNVNLASYFVVDDLALSGTSGIGENTLSEQCLLVHPQPATSNVTVTVNTKNGGNLLLTAYDATGKKVKEFGFENLKPGINIVNINVSEMNNGFYLLKADDSAVKATHLIVKH